MSFLVDLDSGELSASEHARHDEIVPHFLGFAQLDFATTFTYMLDHPKGVRAPLVEQVSESFDRQGVYRQSNPITITLEDQSWLAYPEKGVKTPDGPPELAKSVSDRLPRIRLAPNATAPFVLHGRIRALAVRERQARAQRRFEVLEKMTKAARRKMADWDSQRADAAAGMVWEGFFVVAVFDMSERSASIKHGYG